MSSFAEFSLHITELWLDYASRMVRLSHRMNMTALRLLSVALMVLSFAPLASIYVLWASSLTGPFSTDNEPSVQGGSSPESNINQNTNNVNLAEATSNLMTVIQNPNSTLEEILTSMLLERSFAVGGTMPANMIYHWVAIIPWIISIVFGLVIPIILYMLSLYRSWRLQQERGSNSSERRTRRRRERILPILSEYKIVSACCICVCVLYLGRLKWKDEVMQYNTLLSWIAQLTNKCAWILLNRDIFLTVLPTTPYSTIDPSKQTLSWC